VTVVEKGGAVVEIDAGLEAVAPEGHDAGSLFAAARGRPRKRAAQRVGDDLAERASAPRCSLFGLAQDVRGNIDGRSHCIKAQQRRIMMTSSSRHRAGSRVDSPGARPALVVSGTVSEAEDEHEGLVDGTQLVPLEVPGRPAAA
jgi:hypothetical protein